MNNEQQEGIERLTTEQLRQLETSFLWEEKTFSGHDKYKTTASRRGVYPINSIQNYLQVGRRKHFCVFRLNKEPLEEL